jgi:hypothetical protein
MYENAPNSLDQKRMIDMGVYFSSLIDARSTWPGNGNPRSGPFSVRYRTESLKAEGDDLNRV